MSSNDVREEQRKAYQAYFDRPDSPFAQPDATVGMPETWFLGPKAENEDVLLSMVVQALAQHCAFRRGFHPADPAHVTEEIRRSQDYRDALSQFNDLARTLFEMMRDSAPFASMRYQAHMLWDQALPAVVGYIGSLIYNQNNVAAEASPVTTMLEIKVGNELCGMLGFPSNETITPWGHITCDGSVANIESLWAARNAKFFAIALRQALLNENTLQGAQGLTVCMLDGSYRKLVDIHDVWTLVNLPIDTVVSLPQTIDEMFHIPVSMTTKALTDYTIQNIGLIDFHQNFLSKCAAPVVIAPATRHYSWPKAATLLGLGQNSLRSIPVDLDARMDIGALKKQLDLCLSQKQPVIAVIAVIGSTEESAVDPLSRIVTLREEFRSQGLDFAIHCDAAWGGYFNTIRIPDKTPRAPPATRNLVPGSLLEQRLNFLALLEAEQATIIPSLPLSTYVDEQYKALKEADSITVDPHKAGYAPYPAGSVCYRNSAMRDLISLKAPVVFHSEMEPTVGVYGVEGSKPGAAAAAVWLSHKVIPLTQRGYGKILGQCMWTSKRMFCRLFTMAKRDLCCHRYTVTLFQRTPAERNGKSQAEKDREKTYISNHFIQPTNIDLLNLLSDDPHARDLFCQLGSDQIILAYSFNFIDKQSGDLNRDPKKLSKLNNKIFELCSIMDPGKDVTALPLILTSSEFDVEAYGERFVRSYCDRIGVDFLPDVPISFLISTTMDPWTTDTAGGDFLEVVEDALRHAVCQAIEIIDACEDEDRETAKCN
jgi:glutamate/tyrosine decarboxylase-like PLP-dependent enzyme